MSKLGGVPVCGLSFQKLLLSCYKGVTEIQIGDCSQQGNTIHQHLPGRLSGAAIGGAALAEIAKSGSFQQCSDKLDTCP